MKILALIPARGGSKRVPGKNIKPLGGLPLIAWTIRAACDSGSCGEPLVSTDDPEIAEVARLHGAQVPWLRSAELSSDIAGSVEVALDALDRHEAEAGAIDGLLLLQPTSPFRSAATIQSAIMLFQKHSGARPVVSVSKASAHPAWCFRVSDNDMTPFLGGDIRPQRSQDLEPAWMLNGGVYLIAPKRLRQERRFLTPDTLALRVEDESESIDIDTPADWLMAEALLRLRSLP